MREKPKETPNHDVHKLKARAVTLVHSTLKTSASISSLLSAAGIVTEIKEADPQSVAMALIAADDFVSALEAFAAVLGGEAYVTAELADGTHAWVKIQDSCVATWTPQAEA